MSWDGWRTRAWSTSPEKAPFRGALHCRGYSTEAEDTYLTRCAIIRGKDTIIWIDLNDLLQNGNMALNAKILNNDVIFIPESQSELVYVMGEVRTPGAYNMTGRLTIMDSLMLAGGPTDDADTTTIYLIRKGEGKQGSVREINLSICSPRLISAGTISWRMTMCSMLRKNASAASTMCWKNCPVS